MLLLACLSSPSPPGLIFGSYLLVFGVQLRPQSALVPSLYTPAHAAATAFPSPSHRILALRLARQSSWLACAHGILLKPISWSSSHRANRLRNARDNGPAGGRRSQCPCLPASAYPDLGTCLRKLPRGERFHWLASRYNVRNSFFVYLHIRTTPLLQAAAFACAATIPDPWTVEWAVEYPPVSPSAESGGQGLAVSPSTGISYLVGYFQNTLQVGDLTPPLVASGLVSR